MPVYVVDSVKVLRTPALFLELVCRQTQQQSAGSPLQSAGSVPVLMPVIFMEMYAQVPQALMEQK